MFRTFGLDLSFDGRYYDWSFILIELRADSKAVKGLLAGRHLVPKEVAPGETSLQIVGCNMRRVQVVGPYNEVSIQVPVEPLEDSPNPKLTHLFLPVTTEESRWLGAEVWGFPKFVADIEFHTDSNRVSCRLAEGGQLILEFGMADRSGPKRHYEWDYYGTRKGRVIKTTMDPEGSISESEGGENVSLVLGEHAIAETLRGILLSDRVVRTTVGHNVSSVLKKPVRVEVK